MKPCNAKEQSDKCNRDDKPNFEPLECVLFHQGGDGVSVPTQCSLSPARVPSLVTSLYSAQIKHKPSTRPSDLSRDGAPCSHYGSRLTGSWSSRIRTWTLPGMEGRGCRDVGPGEGVSIGIFRNSTFSKIKLAEPTTHFLVRFSEMNLQSIFRFECILTLVTLESFHLNLLTIFSFFHRNFMLRLPQGRSRRFSFLFQKGLPSPCISSLC